jgi:peptide/nickel transport system substrate-binding protein
MRHGGLGAGAARRLARLGMMGAALATALGVLPAQAQKSADTLRIPFADPIQTAALYYDAKNEVALTSTAIFDTLICYDRHTGGYAPLLAASWRQVDDRTIEFKLRQDVAFHDGAPFTADDVVFTLNWIVDPAAKLRWGVINFGWLERAEKVDAATVRVIAKEPTPLAMLRLAAAGEILSARSAPAGPDKSEYLRKRPIGTGPYKIISFDSDGGVLVKNPEFRHGSPCKPAASIGKIRIIPMPDPQTQLAQLTVGGIDYLLVRAKDLPEMVAGNPDLAVTASEGSILQHLAIDGIGRSGVPALSSLKVRQAIAMALDREFIVRSVLPGGAAIHGADALCARGQLGCDYSTKPPAYDPPGARKLLADAGYADGFDVPIIAMPGSWEVADAISGELRKIGIRATVEKATQGTMREKQAQGRMSLFAAFWPTNTNLDASSIISYYFDETPRNYWNDKTIADWAATALKTADIEKRKAIYRQIYDRNNEQVYVLPLAVVPTVVVHTKDLIIDPDPPHALGSLLYDMRWK